MSISHCLNVYFNSNFQSHDFAYILYPFLNIFKIFGLAPIKLRNGEILRHRSGAIEPIKYDFYALLWTTITMAIYIFGFAIGVHHLYEAHNWDKLRESAVIAFYTSWVQILALFILGAVAALTSWTHINDMQCLFAYIFQIDRKLKRLLGVRIDYKAMRRKFLIEFFVAFIIPVSLSMVNCIIIQPETDFVLTNSCFWFICFAPIMLLTFTEFQFYNILYVLNQKFTLINSKLKSFVGIDGKDCLHQQLQQTTNRMEGYARWNARSSASEIPLSSMPSTESADSKTSNSVPATTIAFSSFNSDVCLTNPSNLEQVCEQSPQTPPPSPSVTSVICLQQLLDVYIKASDAVELLLKIFAWHLLLSTATSIAVIIIQCYNIFAFIMGSLPMNTYQVTFVIAWIFTQISLIAINVSICSTTAKTMARTGPLLRRMKPPTREQSDCCPFYQVLQLFSLEIIQRAHVFSAAGFFDMNFKLITSIIAAVTTYLVIIIQFHLTNVNQFNTKK